MLFQKGRTKLRRFTTIATLGTPQDITLQELRIESFFPMDDETRKVFRKWSVAKRGLRPKVGDHPAPERSDQDAWKPGN